VLHKISIWRREGRFRASRFILGGRKRGSASFGGGSLNSLHLRQVREDGDKGVSQLKVKTGDKEIAGGGKIDEVDRSSLLESRPEGQRYNLQKRRKGEGGEGSKRRGRGDENRQKKRGRKKKKGKKGTKKGRQGNLPGHSAWESEHRHWPNDDPGEVSLGDHNRGKNSKEKKESGNRQRSEVKAAERAASKQGERNGGCAGGVKKKLGK